VVHQIVEINRLWISVESFPPFLSNPQVFHQDTGGRPNDLPLLIVLIVKNLFTIRLM
jgi:hypothetical protein